MGGSNGSEVTLVEGRDLGDTEALGQGDHGGVGRSQREIVILGDAYAAEGMVDAGPVGGWCLDSATSDKAAGSPRPRRVVDEPAV